MTTYLIVFGATVNADGTPSGTLRRRVEGALAVGRSLRAPMFLVTGGNGVGGRTEAEVARGLLMEAGVSAGRILVEPTASDTLASALRCDAILRGRDDVGRVIPCSSTYHLPRCALLMRLLGYRVERRAMPSERPHVARWRLVLYGLKECLALPYDAVQAAWWRALRRARPAS
jgi:vancomycin permeability regulator SanA